MQSSISRRTFISMTGAAVAVPIIIASESVTPMLLDHILLGANDLQQGIEFVEKHTGVRAAFGGVHPGRGTQNALLSLGERRYLEIIAPDPAQSEVKGRLGPRLLSLTEPKLVSWAAHPGTLTTFAASLRTRGFACAGPTPGSRQRSDGKLLQWQTLALDDDMDGLLPFFIEWSADTIHPSVDSPKGCSLLEFAAEAPESEKLQGELKKLTLDLPVLKGEKSRLVAKIGGPKGQFRFTS